MHMTHRRSCQGTSHASTVSSMVLLEKSQHITTATYAAFAVAMTTPMHQTLPRGLASPQPLQHFAMSPYTHKLSPRMVCCERRTAHKQTALCLRTTTIAMQNPCLQCDCLCSLLNSLVTMYAQCVFKMALHTRRAPHNQLLQCRSRPHCLCIVLTCRANASSASSTASPECAPAARSS